MPGKADYYWKYFIVQEMLAVCQIAGCTKPNVSLGPLPKAGEKKRISKYSLLLMYIFNCFLSATGAVTNHLMKNHKQEWDAYCQMRARTNAKVMEAKENGEKARNLLIEKLKAAVVSGQEEPMVSVNRRYFVENVIECCLILSSGLQLSL